MLMLKNWVARATTRTGIPLNIRPVSPDDRSAILTFLRTITPLDLRFRFLGAVKPSEALARILTDVDHSKTEDIIAFDARDGTMVATAMIAEGESPATAEIAVLVRSDWKDHGIGWDMLAEACNYARASGFERAECVESSANSRAAELERKQGFVSRLYPGDAELTLLTKTLN